MIDKDTLDAVLPLPEIEERRDELVAELKKEGFVVTNFHSGGIFYTLLMIVLRIEREFKQFLRNPRDGPSRCRHHDDPLIYRPP